MSSTPLLMGNSFPMSLIRRRVVIEPIPLDEFRKNVGNRRIVSFWGHENTIPAAETLLGLPVKPLQARPAMELDRYGLPLMGGEVFPECWVVSPNYRAGFRPAVGEEVKPEDITGWDILKLTWTLGVQPPDHKK